MNVRIYQINMKRDANNVAFMNYESLPKFQGSSEIDSNLYDKVFEGEVNCFTLEKLYEIFNLKHPAGYKGRSMSVSDVVEIIDGNTGKSYFHFCDSFGFQKVDFDPEKTQVSDRFLSLAEQEKISVLLVPVGKSPIVKEIPNTYEAMKELVGGGGLDEYMLDNRYAILFIRGELPVMDLKYDILKHPNVAYTADGKGGVYQHGAVTKNVATIETLYVDLDSVPEMELSETTYELLSDEDFENLTN